MKMPAPYWRMTYAADRRKHRHRCRHCRKIVQPGEEVFMARVGTKTVVLHVDGCADAIVVHGATEFQLLECRGMSYLARCGFTDAQKWLDESPLTKVRNSYGELPAARRAAGEQS